MDVPVAFVGIENTAYHFDIAYSYTIPDELAESCLPGCRVMVNFGASEKTRRQGIVLSVSTACDSKKYKSVLAVLDKAPLLNCEMLEIVKWLKETTFCTYFEAAKVQLPAGIYLKMRVSYAAAENSPDFSSLTAQQKEVYGYLSARGGYTEKSKLNAALGLLPDCDTADRLCDAGFLVREHEASGRIGDATVKTVRLKDAEYSGRLTPKQKSVYDLLKETTSACVRELCYFTGVGVSVISALEKKGVAEIYDSAVYRAPEISDANKPMSGDIILTDEQNRAYKNMLERYKTAKGGATLLFGVTGSGKTGVYMRLIDDVIADGRGVIVMVPEISLTAQALSIFKSRYGSKIAVFHSALSMGERRDEYLRVRRGEAQIAIGTRSAVFAPFEKLGLIVIDEEQESTYKSEASPRYDAREVARMRCAYHGAALVLSSATPSVESFAYAKGGRYSMEKLTERYGDARLPDVITVDLRQDRACGNKYEISGLLLQQLEENLEDGRQSILLINRRGYNTFIACNSCGHVITCPSCSISLTYHTANGRMMCHYCGYSAPLSDVCGQCGKKDIRYSGYGTQKIEDELSLLLPQARVLRMDADTTMSRFSHGNKLRAFEKGEYDILLGTQMVAKGLDFENVTLVGVVCADQQLNNDDFRSMERTFDLLTQVVGRSGRGCAAGRAVIQTLTPENNVIRLAARQDYEAFYESEIAIRKYMKYPPFCDICSVMFISKDEAKASLCSRAFLDDVRALALGEYAGLKLIVLGPMPPRVAKVNDKYRFRLLIKCKNDKKLRSMISTLLISYGKKREFSDITLTADINPSSLI